MSRNNFFWQNKSLLDMTHDEWESICDGCAKCCLVKLQDEDTDLVVFTNIACDLLNDGTCRCTDYENRTQKVPACIAMNRNNINQVSEYAPPSCSYRLLLAGEPLPKWHHLVSGSKELIHDDGHSVQNKVCSSESVDMDDLESYVVDWI